MRQTALFLICAILCAAPVAAQSLGDLARKEEQRRKAVAAPGKVYTNDDLRTPAASAEPAQPAAAAPAAEAAAKDGVAKDGAAAKDGPAAKDGSTPEAKKDESYWRKQLQAERDAIERAKVLVDALQGRINAMQTDFVNRDDPAARAAIGAERQRVIGELDKTKLEIKQRTKAISDLQEEARRAGVPAAWYR